MRLALATFALICFLSSGAQTYLPVSQLGYNQGLSISGYRPIYDTGASDHRWHLSKYAGLSAGTLFFAGGVSFFSAPVIGMQLSHSLNKNLYAFGAVSAAPIFFSGNRLATAPVPNHFYPGSNFPNANAFGLSSKVEMGLMYINDAKTFSISGSFGVERESYPVYPSGRTNAKNPALQHN